MAVVKNSVTVSAPHHRSDHRAAFSANPTQAIHAVSKIQKNSVPVVGAAVADLADLVDPYTFERDFGKGRFGWVSHLRCPGQTRVT
jgi:hypothetical protein